MQPFQRVSEEKRERQKMPLDLLKKAGTTAVTAAKYASGGSLIAHAIPFLKEGVTAERTIQGLSKISSMFGNFINQSLKAGKSFEEVKDFIKSKVDVAEENMPQSLFRKLVGDIDVTKLDDQATKELSFFEKIASQLESKGKSEKDPEVKKLKKKIDKALKGMSGMVMGEAMAQAPEGESEQMMGQQQMDPGQIQGQPGRGEQALMAILQKIQASRGM